MADARIQTRKLRKADAGANALAKAAGAHGIYVQNALASGLHDGHVFVVDGEDCGVAWFGPRGNLVITADERLQSAANALAEVLRRSRWFWRIAMGPDWVIDAVRETQSRTPLVCRDQIYYVAEPSTAAPGLVTDEVRAPVVDDRERLARATLALNASDLNIAPARVDRRWLYDTIDERIDDGTTRVLGPVGGLHSKLDFGSDGPGGRVIEGVFTFPEFRGRGLGSRLVAACIREAPDSVSLHVAESNTAARRAYEKAGMREVSRCRLLLMG